MLQYFTARVNVPISYFIVSAGFAKHLKVAVSVRIVEVSAVYLKLSPDSFETLVMI